MAQIKAKDIKVGMQLDLEGDCWADGADEPSLDLKFEYADVLAVERETPDCIRVETNVVTVGFPLDHLVTLSPVGS